MSKKVKIVEEKKLENPKIINGYLIYNTEEKAFIDDNEYETFHIQEAFIYETFEEAKDYIEETDYPNIYEIHETEIIYDIKNIIKRRIVYEPEAVNKEEE